MDARQWGELFGALTVPLIIGIVVAVLGWRSQRRKANGGSSGARFGYVALGVVIFVVGAAIILYQRGSRSDDSVIAGFNRGLTGTCLQRCKEARVSDAICQSYCACIVDEIHKRVTREEIIGVARQSTSPNAQNVPWRGKAEEAGRVCAARNGIR